MAGETIKCEALQEENRLVLQILGSSGLVVQITWLVDHVVDPSLALLDSNSPPLRLSHQVVFGHQFG